MNELYNYIIFGLKKYFDRNKYIRVVDIQYRLPGQLKEVPLVIHTDVQ